MRRSLALVAAIVAAVALTCSTADAHWRKGDPRLRSVELGASIASTATYFSLVGFHHRHSAAYGWGVFGAVTGGCVVLSPIVATMVVNRPLTQREAHVLIGSCIVPVIGGWLVEQAYDAHPNWEPQPVAVRHHRKKMAKM
ncbi:MAG: hypothetical protein ACR2K5_03995 [Pseudolabrys sp.]